MTWVETEHAKKDNEDNVLNSSTTNITHLFEDDKALVLAPSIIQLGLNGEVVENEEAKEAFEKIHGDDNLKRRRHIVERFLFPRISKPSKPVWSNKQF